MVWFKVDDNLGSHPKTGQAGLRAMGLWVVAGSWSARYLTDGAVHKSMLMSWGAKPADAAALVRAGLWDVTPDGWQFHDWAEFQPTKTTVQADRRASAARQLVARSPKLREAVRERDGDLCQYCGVEVRWTDRRGQFGGTYDHVMPDGPSDLDNLVVCCRGCNAAKGRRTPEQAGMNLSPFQVGPKSELVTSRDVHDPRTRPVPVPEEVLPTGLEPAKSPSVARASQRARRLDPAWVPDPADHQRMKFTDQQAAEQLASFRDYWCSRGRDAARLDWQATWRNWLRNTDRRRAGTNGHKPSTTSQRVNEGLELAAAFDRGDVPTRRALT